MLKECPEHLLTRQKKRLGPVCVAISTTSHTFILVTDMILMASLIGCQFASNGKRIKECFLVVNPLCLALVLFPLSLMVAFFWVLEPQISLSMHTYQTFAINIWS